MASDNETVAEIIKWLRDKDYYRGYMGITSVLTDMVIRHTLDRIEAAHDREVAELKRWMKSAARWIVCHDIYHTSGDDLIKQAKEILDDDGEFLFKNGER